MMGSRQWVEHERLETLPFQCRTKQVDITVLPLQLLVRFPLDLGKRFDTSVFSIPVRLPIRCSCSTRATRGGTAKRRILARVPPNASAISVASLRMDSDTSTRSMTTRSMNRNDDSGVSLVSVRFQMMPLTRCPPKRTRTITPGWAASEYFSST